MKVLQEAGEEVGEDEERGGRGREEGKGQSSTTQIAESRTGRITREVICRLGFISKAGLISFCLCLNEIAK